MLFNNVPNGSVYVGFIDEVFFTEEMIENEEVPRAGELFFNADDNTFYFCCLDTMTCYIDEFKSYNVQKQLLSINNAVNRKILEYRYSRYNEFHLPTLVDIWMARIGDITRFKKDIK